MRKTLLSTTAAAALLLGSTALYAQTERSGGASPSATQSQSQSPSTQRGSEGRSMNRGNDAGDRAQNRGGRDQNTGQAGSDRGQQTQRQGRSGSDQNTSQGAGEASQNDSQAGSERRDRNQAHERGQNQRDQAGERRQNREQTREQGQDRRDQARDRRREDRDEARGERRENRGQAREDRRDGNRDRSAGRDRGGDSRVTLSTEQRTRVRDVIERRGSRARTNVNFNVSVGVAVPTRVRLYDLPPDIVTIVPQYRGYKYVVVRDEVVIIHPRTKKVVTVISDSGSNVGSRPSSRQRVTFTEEQRRVIRRHATRRWADRPADFRLSIGATLPNTVELYEFPEVVFGEVPMVREYRYVVIDDDILVVDPDEHRIVQVIED